MMDAVVVDLDGTLMNTNTFQKYIVFVCRNEIRRFRFLLPIQLALYVLFRKCRMIKSHEQFKKKVLVASQKYYDCNEMVCFSQSLKSYVNHHVASIVSDYQDSGLCTVLATAAPACYAKIISQQFHFTCCCATSFPDTDDWHENVKEQKKENTLRLLEERGDQLAVLITDHYDDMPLLQIPKKINYIVNPSYSICRELKSHNIDFVII